MSEDLNAVERAYKYLNDKTQIRITLDQWIAIGISFLPMVLSDLLHVPAKRFVPPVMLLLFLFVQALRKRLSLKVTLQAAIMCLLLYFILSPVGLKP
jgi:hypothetical protein